MGCQLVVFVGNSFLAFLVLSYALAVSSQQSGVYTTLVNLIIYQLPENNTINQKGKFQVKMEQFELNNNIKGHCHIDH